MSMYKVCPKCKNCSKVMEIAFPASRITTMEMVAVYNEKGKPLLGTCEVEVIDTYCDFTMDSDPPVYECPACDYEYKGGDYEECWEEMVWRKA